MPVQFRITNLIVCITIGLLAANTGYGQKDPSKLENMSLEDLLNVKITTVSKVSQKAGEAPATVIVVTADQIKTRGYRNLAQILNDLPDFKVHDKSDPQFFNPISLRGNFRQDYFVILLDGMRISSPTNEPLPILENFPIYLAKQIEVVYGPGSALYGADAMAGVINIITEKGTDRDRLEVRSIMGTQGYSSNSLYLYKTLPNNFRFTVAGLYSYDAQPDFSKIYPDAYDMTSHQTGLFNSIYGPVKTIQPIDARYQAPVKTYNVYAALSNGKFDFKLLRHYAQVPSSTTLKPDNGVYNKDVFYGHGVTTAGIGYTDSIGMVKSLTTITASFYNVNPESNFRNVYGSMNHGYKYSYGSMAKAEEQLSYSPIEKLQLVGGITYEQFHSIPKTPELEYPVNEKYAERGVLLNTSYPLNPGGISADFYTITYNNTGAYFQTQYKAIKALAFTAGVRYDHNSRYGATFNPRIGAVFFPRKNTTIKALYGTAYWAPSPMKTYEAYGSFYSTDSGKTYQAAYLSLPNPGLRPVTSKTSELSINQKLGRKLNVTVTGYYTSVHNIIKNVSDNMYAQLYNNRYLGWNASYVSIPYNLGNQHMTGGNLMLNSLFDLPYGSINVYGSVSYIDGKVEALFAGNKVKKVDLPLIAPWQFRLGVNGKWNAFYLSARLQMMGKQRLTGYLDDNNPGKRQTIDGYALMNASAGYTLANRFTFFVNVENALNTRFQNPLDANLNDPGAPTYAGSYQDPIRVMGGIRISLDK